MPIGNVDISKVSGASIAYTVKYINKGPWKPMHQNDDRVPEFPLMSKRLGSNYLTDQVIASFRSNITKSFVLLEGGVKMGLPRYYKNKIFPVDCSKELVESHPSILIHLDENKFFRKLQAEIVRSTKKSLTPVLSVMLRKKMKEKFF